MLNRPYTKAGMKAAAHNPMNMAVARAIILSSSIRARTKLASNIRRVPARLALRDGMPKGL